MQRRRYQAPKRQQQATNNIPQRKVGAYYFPIYDLEEAKAKAYYGLMTDTFYRA